MVLGIPPGNDTAIVAAVAGSLKAAKRLVRAHEGGFPGWAFQCESFNYRQIDGSPVAMRAMAAGEQSPIHVMWDDDDCFAVFDERESIEAEQVQWLAGGSTGIEIVAGRTNAWLLVPEPGVVN